jgi:hypothetical protein
MRVYAALNSSRPVAPARSALANSRRSESVFFTKHTTPLALDWSTMSECAGAVGLTYWQATRSSAATAAAPALRAPFLIHDLLVPPGLLVIADDRRNEGADRARPGGDVTVQSTEGQGSTFIFEFPRSAAEHA